ncbi:MAG TPA: glycoside hydrolase family 2 TIM barrel-domain containing protein [Terriglobales bacterium]|nr:glycoside hydrolase family 2 TIM barrel-domain containing protein [Terriglobales bacterium]
MREKNWTRREFVTSVAIAGAVSALESASAQAHHKTPGAAAQEALAARKVSLDDGWKFTRGDVPGAEALDFPDATWSRVDLPHDWSIAGPFAREEPSGGSGAFARTGIGWYRRRLVSRRDHGNRRVSILFDGVYQRSEVWINGHSLGMRPYGYISFACDLTLYLNASGDNVLAVRVDNSLQPNSRWYSGSGIYRHVWLTTTAPLHIAQWGTTIRTPEVSADRAAITLATRVQNEGSQVATCALTTEIVDASGTAVATSTVEMKIPAGVEHIFEQQLAMAQPALWSTMTPIMYAARQTLSTNGAQIDAASTPFGIRSIVFDVDKGFLLNGAQTKMNGVCLHGDGGCVGTAVPERVWERRLETLKEMGCNAIRCSHNPPAPEFLDLCDRMGFLVMDEAFDEWRDAKGQTRDYGYHKYFDEWWKRDVRAMIARDRNHPSIVIWSAGNEIPDQLDPRGAETAAALVGLFHAEDPTRLVTAACDNIAADPKATPEAFLTSLDVVGYNYVDRWRDRREKYYSIDRHDYPQRRFIGTESVAISGVRGQYAPPGAAAGRWGFASNGLIEVEQLQKFIQTYDYVSGDFMWTGIDYLGESRWPNRVATAGQIDTCGFRKDSFYFYQSIWTDKPVLHLSPHWNWSGHEGEVIPVTCFTNCDTVELFLNGKSLGVKGYAFRRPGMTGRYGNYPPRARELQTTADLHLTWDVPYTPGTLKAVGSRLGQVVKTTEVHTTSAPAAIRLTPDRDRIGTARGDVCHVAVEIIDKGGLLVPTANNALKFELSGAGRILGLDNGRPDSHESFQGTEREAFNGMALAVLQPSGSKGTMTLKVSNDGLTSAGVTVVVG